jgi:hypothetical protein
MAIVTVLDLTTMTPAKYDVVLTPGGQAATV